MKSQLFSFFIAVLFTGFSSFTQAQAKIIVYRPGCIYGSLAKYKVNLDGKEVATLKGKSMYTADVAPGSHTIAPKQAKRAVTINADANQTYVVKYGTPLHLFGARPKLKVMTLAEAEKSKKFRRMEKSKM